MNGENDHLFEMPDDACIECGERAENCKCSDERVLALPAPARFKISKTIKLPSVTWASSQLDYWHSKRRELVTFNERRKRDRNWRNVSPLHDERTIEANLKAWRLNLDCAEFCRDYVAQHDCKPIVLEKGTREHGLTRFARVQVESDIYQVSVRTGRHAMGMYGVRGHKYHLSVYRQGTAGDLTGGEYCGKSEGLTSNAVREHLFRLWRLTRGRRERSQDERWRML